MENISYMKLTNLEDFNRLAKVDMRALKAKEGLHHAIYKNGCWQPINLNEYFFPFGVYNDEYEDITEIKAKDLIDYWDKKDGVFNV